MNGLQHATSSAINHTMSATITMDPAGRIVIPKDIRAGLHLEKGAKLQAEIVGGRLELKPIIEEQKLKIVHKHGLPVIAKTGKPFSAAEAVRQMRAEREKTLVRRVRSPRR
jgi:AbrB family looped-hinge helix DNA binding protein